MTQYGFYFDMNSCIGCRTCQISCKDKNDLAIGNLFRQVRTFEVGEYPNGSFYHFATTCNHCDNPACLATCPQGAYSKDEKTGAVLHDDDACIGCQLCVKACPYGVPQYVLDSKIVKKCDMCHDLTSQGQNPTCVDACPMRVLEWGPIDELNATHGDAVLETAVYPDSTATGPNTVVSAKAAALKDTFVQKLV